MLIFQVVLAMEELIEEHQRIPGSITRGLVERIYRVPKTKKLPPQIAEDLAEKLKEQEDMKSELEKKLIDLDSLKSELETNLETLNLSDFPPEVVKTNNGDLKSKSVDFESKIDDADIKPENDIKTNGFETNDDKSDGAEVKLYGVEINDINSNVAKSNVVKCKDDVKFDDVKSNEAMYNNVIISTSVASTVAKHRKSRDSPKAKNEVIITNGNTVKQKES